jgi:succinate dehydrogenase/fumarate reductase flavoprotein subunit
MSIERIQHDADVVVIGCGPAGMAAVAAAADRGVEVLALEAGDQIGGNVSWSTGYVAFVDTEMQRRAGIADSEELFMEDAARIVDMARDRYGVVWDEELTRVFARESSVTYRELSDRGVLFTRFIPRPKQHRVDRMAAVDDPAVLAHAFARDFDRPNVRIAYGITARRLVTEGGAVVGVMAEDRDDQELVVRARRAVVLAAGGYQANPELRQRYQPEFLARGPYLGIDTCRGDGHLMAQAVGGDLINMTFVPPLAMVSSALVEDSIAINRVGQRFHDEAGPYEERVDALAAQPDRWAAYLFDAVVAERRGALIAQMPAPVVSGDTLTALADELGVPADELERTVRRWNALVESEADRDPATGRVVLPADRGGIRTPPYSATRMAIGVNFPSGGLVVTTSMQAVDVFGTPIPGLYAAGDCVGGFNPVADLGGIHIGGGFTFGRIAGRSAALGESTPPHGRTSPFGAFLPSPVSARLEIVDTRGG